MLRLPNRGLHVRRWLHLLDEVLGKKKSLLNVTEAILIYHLLLASR